MILNALILVLLAGIGVYDFLTKKIEVGLLKMLGGVVLIKLFWTFFYKGNGSHLILGGVVAFFLTFLIALVSKGLGGGDIKLFTVIGFGFGLKAILAIMLITSALMAVVGIFYYIRDKTLKDKQVAMAPYIFIATVFFIIVKRGCF